MIFTVSQMQSDVRIAIDMNHSSTQLLEDDDVDTLQLDEIIKDKLVDAVRLVELECPSYMLEKGHDFVEDSDTEDDITDDRTIEWMDRPTEPTAVEEDSDDYATYLEEYEAWEEEYEAWKAECDARGGYRGSIVLPDDFMRLVAFRMSDWRRAVYSAYSESDEEYAQMSSRYNGICGNPEKPAVAIVSRSEGLALEFYSCNSEDAKVTHAVYIPLPEITDEGIDISEKCYRAAVYRAAYLTLVAVGDQNAAAMLEISKSLLV